jgi:hypothetical protein
MLSYQKEKKSLDQTGKFNSSSLCKYYTFAQLRRKDTELEFKHEKDFVRMVGTV